MASYDLILLHAPSIFDFRKRDDLLLAYLSNSDTISVSPIYEMYPLGLKAMAQSLAAQKHRVSIVNLAGMMLQEPALDVAAFLASLQCKIMGLDFHWLAHTQGVLAVAALFKKYHPRTPVLVGGLAASFFYRELLDYPQIDFVVRGVTASPYIHQLLTATADGRSLHNIPNLCWKDHAQTVIVNPLQETEAYDVAVDWASPGPTLNSFLLFPSAGCDQNCTFCSGANYTMRKYFGVKEGIAEKKLPVLLHEIASMKAHAVPNKRVITVHHWFEDMVRLQTVLPAFQNSGIGTVHFTLYHLISPDHLNLIAQSGIRPVFEISLESHVPEIRRLCGKAPYSNAELESWLDTLFSTNRKAVVEIYLMIGLPRQTMQTVMEEVGYAEHLLQKYAKKDLQVYIAAMAPFLDPGSLFYENAEQFGYKIRFQSLKEYEQALCKWHWKESLNYETDWMSRREIVLVTYQAVRMLALIKQKLHKFPLAMAQMVVQKIDETMLLLEEIERYENQEMPQRLRQRVADYNATVLSRATSQQSPINLNSFPHWYQIGESYAPQ